MRVLHVINQLDIRAGAETSLRELVISSHSSEFYHGIVVLRGTVPDRESLDRIGVPLFVPRPPNPNRMGGIRHVLTSITEFEPDLIHTSLFEADLAGRIAGRFRSIPAITSLVNTPYWPQALDVETAPRWKLKLVQRIDRLLARRATTAFHAISDATAEHAAEHLGVDPRIVRVVPRGRQTVELGSRTAERRNDVRAREGWGQHCPIILNVAREEPQKGHALLLQAFVRVLEGHPDSLLILAGRPGRSSAEIARIIDREGLNGVVQRLGERRDVADLLVAADLFVVSSLYEGLGGAVVEASGLRLPTVAFDVPAVVEILGGNHPWLVPTGDAEQLGAVINAALNSGVDRLQQVGALQRQRFEDRYEMTNVVEQMLNLYREVCQLTAKPPQLSRVVQVSER
jgi:glycosyltransferase involved in cell wall biosynthesis